MKAIRKIRRNFGLRIAGVKLQRSSEIRRAQAKRGGWLPFVYAFEVLVNSGFKVNPTCYAGIMYKVRAITQAELRAHMNDDKNPQRLPVDHPMQKLMRRPNPHMTGADLQIYRTMMYNICGNSYIWIERDALGTPIALWPMRPDRVQRIDRGLGPDGVPMLNYVFIPKTRERTLPSELLQTDVIHDSFLDPLDEYDGAGTGLAPLQVAAQPMANDNEFSSFIANLTENGLLVPGVVQSENYITQSTADDIRERFKERYSGYENWGEPIVLGENTTFDPIPMALQEELFRAMDARNETRILQILGLDPILLRTVEGMTSTTYTNMVQAQKDFWNHTFAFDLKIMAAQFDLRLSMDDQYRFMYDTAAVWALSGDIRQKAETARILISAMVPPDEAYRKVGLDIDDLPDGLGKKVYLGSDLLPLEKVLGEGDGGGESEMMSRGLPMPYRNGKYRPDSDFDDILERLKMPGFLDELEAIRDKAG